MAANDVPAMPETSGLLERRQVRSGSPQTRDPFREARQQPLGLLHLARVLRVSALEQKRFVKSDQRFGVVEGFHGPRMAHHIRRLTGLSTAC